MGQLNGQDNKAYHKPRFATNPNQLIRDEARRIAANITKLPELLRPPPPIKRGVTRLQPHISRQSAQCPLL